MTYWQRASTAEFNWVGAVCAERNQSGTAAKALLELLCLLSTWWQQNCRSPGQAEQAEQGTGAVEIGVRKQWHGV